MHVHPDLVGPTGLQATGEQRGHGVVEAALHLEVRSRRARALGDGHAQWVPLGSADRSVDDPAFGPRISEHHRGVDALHLV